MMPFTVGHHLRVPAWKVRLGCEGRAGIARNGVYGKGGRLSVKRSLELRPWRRRRPEASPIHEKR
jgi:hypothetical protein